jgi:hypothetical protein
MELENKVETLKELLRKKEEDHRNQKEELLAKRAIIQEQLMGSFSHFGECFEKEKSELNKDLDRLEKSVKVIRRKRRHIRAKHASKFRSAEQDLEDLMSSSEDPLKKNEREGGDDGQMLEESKQQEEDCKLPRMAIGGVPIDENGNPIENNISHEWISEYEDTTNSQVIYYRR